MEIVREKSKTVVIVDDGVKRQEIPLEETVIAFGTAIEQKQLEV